MFAGHLRAARVCSPANRATTDSHARAVRLPLPAWLALSAQLCSGYSHTLLGHRYISSMSVSSARIAGDGWRGDLCDEPRPCLAEPCLHGGTCSDADGDAQCACADGWHGAACAQAASTPGPCVSYPCANGAQHACAQQTDMRIRPVIGSTLSGQMCCVSSDAMPCPRACLAWDRRWNVHRGTAGLRAGRGHLCVRVYAMPSRTVPLPLPSSRRVPRGASRASFHCYEFKPLSCAVQCRPRCSGVDWTRVRVARRLRPAALRQRCLTKPRLGLCGAHS